MAPPCSLGEDAVFPSLSPSAPTPFCSHMLDGKTLCGSTCMKRDLLWSPRFRLSHSRAIDQQRQALQRYRAAVDFGLGDSLFLGQAPSSLSREVGRYPSNTTNVHGIVCGITYLVRNKSRFVESRRTMSGFNPCNTSASAVYSNVFLYKRAYTERNDLVTNRSFRNAYLHPITSIQHKVTYW